MSNLPLLAIHGDGSAVNQPLPTIAIQTYWDKSTQQLAVIFDVANSPIVHFYANFHTYNPLTLTRIMQEDYLWQSNCYELFLAFDNTPDSPYIEINFSPEGYFNIYHFDGYRKPKRMPPPRLELTEKQRQQLVNFYNVAEDRQVIFWQESTPQQQKIRDLVEKNFPLKSNHSRLVMMVEVAFLAKLCKVMPTDNIWLNACGVYKDTISGELAYFAHQHATPPDFHDKKYWLLVCNN